jgi:hypothetical protein
LFELAGCLGPTKYTLELRNGIDIKEYINFILFLPFVQGTRFFDHTLDLYAMGHAVLCTHHAMEG